MESSIGILTTAKGASASYVPIGITAVSKEIADFLRIRCLHMVIL